MQPTISNLTFGVEFEVIMPPGMSRATGAAEVSQRAGFPVSDGGRIPGTWKVVYDGSLQGAGQGLEFVSPVLRGDDGLEQVRKVANALTAIGATVNTSCGFHVHVGARGEGVEFFKTLGKLYARYEQAIDELMPASRRGNSNHYCRSISMRGPAIDAARTVQQAIAAVSPDRYHKLNFQAFSKHSTVEFRQHSGTLNADRATNWIVVCLRLVAAAKAGKTGEAGRIASDFSRLEAKAKAVAEAITRPGGATADEIRAVHGFRALSVNRQAAIAGLTVRVQRERGRDRFFADLPRDDATAIPTTLDGLCEVIGAEDEERAALRARRSQVSR